MRRLRETSRPERLRESTEIVATGFAYPSLVVDNDEYFARCRFPIADGPEGRAALVRDTRMKTRRWCGPGENTLTMARDAVADLLASGKVDPGEIDLVVVSSCSTIPCVNYPDPDNPVVADLAPYILAQLGRDDAVGVDIKGSYCAGFLRGLEVLDSMLENPDYRCGLLVASDEGGRYATAESNRSAFCFVVGDSAGAIVLRKRPAAPRVGLIDHIGATVISKGDLQHWGADGVSLVVKGARASAAAGALMYDAARRLLTRNRIAPSELDWLLPPQTHPATVEALCDALEIPREKLLWHGDRTGYAASASIATALAEKRADGTIRKGDLVLSVTVGAGMNVAGSLYYA